jgi:hypothetical protein
VLLEFPSREAFEGFYHSPAYQDLHALRDEVSYARMVGVEAFVEVLVPPIRLLICGAVAMVRWAARKGATVGSSSWIPLLVITLGGSRW